MSGSRTACIRHPLIAQRATSAAVFQHRHNAPARSRYGRLETEAADNLFKDRVGLRMSRELRGYFDAAAFLEIGAVEPPQAELAVAGALQQQGEDMRLLRISADNPDAV